MSAMADERGRTSGFTLLETLVASAVLSTALLVAVGALVQLRTASEGAAMRLEQEEARHTAEVEALLEHGER